MGATSVLDIIDQLGLEEQGPAQPEAQPQPQAPEDKGGGDVLARAREVFSVPLGKAIEEAKEFHRKKISEEQGVELKPTGPELEPTFFDPIGGSIRPRIPRKKKGAGEIRFKAEGEDGIDTIFDAKGLNDEIAALRGRHDQVLKDLNQQATPIDIGSRGLARLKEDGSTPEGMVNFLKDRFGAENIVPVFGEDGGLEQVFIQDRREGLFEPGSDKGIRVLDKRAANFTEILDDLPGDAVDIFPDLFRIGVEVKTALTGAGLGAAAGAPIAGLGAVPGAVIGGVGGAFVGGVAADAALQGAAAALPGEGFPGEGEAGRRVTKALGAGAAAGVGELIPVAGRAAKRFIRGKRSIAKDLTTVGGDTVPIEEALVKGTEEAESQGIKLSAGEITQAPELLAIEDPLRRGGAAAPIFARVRNENLKTAARVLSDKLGGALESMRLSSEDSVRKLIGIGNQRNKVITKAAVETGDRAYSEARKLSGGAKIVDFTPITDEIAKIKKEFSGPFRSDKNAQLAKWLDTQKNALNKADKPLVSFNPRGSIEDMQGILAALGPLTAGTEVAVEGMRRRTSMAVARRLRDATFKAMENVGAHHQGAARAALKANGEYKAAWDAVAKEQKTAFMRLVRKHTPKDLREGFPDPKRPQVQLSDVTPDDIPDTKPFVSAILSMDTGAQRSLMKSARALGPEAAEALSEAVVTRILSPGLAKRGGAEGAVGLLHAGRLSKSILENMETLKVMMPDAAGELGKLGSNLEKMNTWVQGSQTAGAQALKANLPVIGPATKIASAASAPAKTVREVLSNLNETRLTRAVFSKEERMELIKVTLPLLDISNLGRERAAVKLLKMLSSGSEVEEEEEPNE